MSLIHTCELNGTNPFGYLTELMRHAEQLQQDPAAWMPWNYPTLLENCTASRNVDANMYYRVPPYDSSR
jgi:hypothetical protein